MRTRRPCRPLCAVALVAALSLVAACKTDSDPRKGGFISGVTNLATGGYDSYVEEKRDELEASEAESQTLEARARAIEVEREALDRDIDEAARRLGLLQERLAFLHDKLAATEQTTADERRKLEEAREKAEAAQDRLGVLRRGETQSIEVRRQGVGDLKDLIASVALMVDDLSN
jgi:hypothetical protein